MKHRSRYSSLLRASFALILWQIAGLGGGSALASQISIVPTGLSLNAAKSTDLITLHNGASTPVSLQLSAFRWDQTPEGSPKLTPTDDVVFFPPIVTLEGKEDRIIRVGAMVPFGLTEKSYRLIAEELPPPRFQALPPGAPQRIETRVVVLTRMSIPVFLSPPAAVHQESLEEVSVQNGRLSFQVKNNGNAHVLAGAAKVTGWSADNRSLFSVSQQSTHGFYLLPGEPLQDYADLPNPPCNELRKIAVEVPITEPFGEYDLRTNMLKAEVPLGPGNCGPERRPGAASGP